MRIAGWVLSALLTLQFCMSAYFKLAGGDQFAEAVGKMGFDLATMQKIGWIEIVVAILFIVPQTAMLGAILLTGYMGGAIVTHVRVGENCIAQAVIAIVVWVALGLRQPEIFRLAFGGLIPMAPKNDRAS
jgi:uncharacterized membrane protein YphA (DoxX/SURF4 family)